MVCELKTLTSSRHILLKNVRLRRIELYSLRYIVNWYTYNEKLERISGMRNDLKILKRQRIDGTLYETLELCNI